MTVITIFLVLLTGVGVLLYIHNRLYYGRKNGDVETQQEAIAEQDEEEACCGMHITCERDSLVAGLDPTLLYYDDEELDVYRGRESTGYTPEETEQFREVLLTLQPDDIAGWARSISTRGITLPTDVRDELLMIVSEARNNRKDGNT